MAGSGAAVAALVSGGSTPASAGTRPRKWDHDADVVVVGTGASGFPAAIVACEAGSSVLMVEVQPHIGGHGICSGGNIPLGGGNSMQKKYGIKDSPDLFFRDLTDWSVVEPNGFPDYRYNDREIVRAFADHSVATFEWLRAHGVVFVEKAPDTQGGTSVGNSVPRVSHAAVMDWPMVQTGKPADPSVRTTTSSGNGLIRPLEAAARKAGVRILLEHKMVSLYRDGPGRVIGIAAEHNGRTVNIRARKGVILGTGGSSSNVAFRRQFDVRLTEEYCGVAGQPWSDQDAGGELAAMALGASLWGGFNETGEFGFGITKPGSIGTRYGYVNLSWMPGSPVFDRVGATGLKVADWQDVILVNMLGNRFYDETGPQFTANNYDSIDPYIPDSYLNAKNVKYNPNNWINAALAGIGDTHNGGGPIWAVFDSDAVARENWDPRPPNVDVTGGFFFQADTLSALAAKIRMRFQRVPMNGRTLVDTVGRYNGFVDAGRDADFAKPGPKWKINKPPFYAAWSTPVVHDTRVGLRINAECQVIDLSGDIIDGLYACGETAGGFSMHGLPRALCQGYIAGKNI
ncbi:FAD-binding protein [Actinomadura sp. DC4]|uniref:FAD-dependent oxidoreductase n=1 Tax=Actinomadura sp. DC4 TaxID=3055069 RepID=UPI0025B0CD31|nr:FAD-binding protein [Actinomadura sp. DC4]MDN3355832.1 FAD-binding protein [Actinomadura sp. DC4]